EEVYEIEDTNAPAVDDNPYQYHEPKRRGWMTLAIVFLIGLIVVGGGGTLWYMRKSREKQEMQWAGEAQKLLHGKQYSQPARQYEDLTKEFERSKSLTRYRFFKGYCEACDAATGVAEPPSTRREKFSAYVTQTEGADQFKPILDERRDEIYEVMLRIAQDQATDAEQKQKQNDFEGARASIDALSKAEGSLRQHATKKVKEPVPEDLAKRIAALNTSVGEAERYANFL